MWGEEWSDPQAGAEPEGSMMSLHPLCQAHLQAHRWFKLHLLTYVLGRQENRSFIDEAAETPEVE